MTHAPEILPKPGTPRKRLQTDSARYQSVPTARLELFPADPVQAGIMHAVDERNQSIYCNGCGYNLAGLEQSRCPECGRGFDTGDPRTFRRRPLRRGWVRWGVRAGVLLVLLAGGSAGGLAWLHKDWRIDRDAIPAVTYPKQPVSARVTPNVTMTRIGPDWLQKLLGSHADLLDRASGVNLRCHRIREEELAGIARLHHLRDLRLYYVGLTDQNLASLRDLKELRTLDLTGNAPITDEGLIHLRGLRNLHTIKLGLTKTGDGGMDHLASLRQLETIILDHTKITSAGLARLALLDHLKELSLRYTAIDDAGVAHLIRMRSLVSLTVTDTEIRDEGLQRLALLPNLAKLYVTVAAKGISAEGAERFKRTRPDVALRVSTRNP